MRAQPAALFGHVIIFRLIDWPYALGRLLNYSRVSLRAILIFLTIIIWWLKRYFATGQNTINTIIIVRFLLIHSYLTFCIINFPLMTIIKTIVKCMIFSTVDRRVLFLLLLVDFRWCSLSDASSLQPWMGVAHSVALLWALTLAVWLSHHSTVILRQKFSSTHQRKIRHFTFFTPLDEWLMFFFLKLFAMPWLQRSRTASS